VEKLQYRNTGTINLSKLRSETMDEIKKAIAMANLNKANRLRNELRDLNLRRFNLEKMIREVKLQIIEADKKANWGDL
jgi:hypothetical protein